MDADREGKEEQTVSTSRYPNSKGDITFFEFLRLFSREVRKEELALTFKDHQALLDSIKLSMI